MNVETQLDLVPPAGSLLADQAAAGKAAPATPLPASDRIYHSQFLRDVSGDSIQVGSLLGNCLITGQLGQGSCCRIFLALHQRLHIVVALKVLWPTAQG
jgi:hypothetical protein